MSHCLATGYPFCSNFIKIWAPFLKLFNIAVSHNFRLFGIQDLAHLYAAGKHVGQVASCRIGKPQVSQVFSKLAALVSTVAAVTLVHTASENTKGVFDTEHRCVLERERERYATGVSWLLLLCKCCEVRVNWRIFI